MKTKNAITVRPGPDLPALKRAKSLIRLTESILGKSTAPARNRTDEQGRKQAMCLKAHTKTASDTAIGFFGIPGALCGKAHL